MSEKLCFDPRPHARGDVRCSHSPSSSESFRSTPPREGRPLGIAKYGVDLEVSIHAPTRGATALAERRLPLLKVSIHAPTRGATTGRRKHTTQ